MNVTNNRPFVLGFETAQRFHHENSNDRWCFNAKRIMLYIPLISFVGALISSAQFVKCFIDSTYKIYTHSQNANFVKMSSEYSQSIKNLTDWISKSNKPSDDLKSFTSLSDLKNKAIATNPEKKELIQAAYEEIINLNHTSWLGFFDNKLNLKDQLKNFSCSLENISFCDALNEIQEKKNVFFTLIEEPERINTIPIKETDMDKYPNKVNTQQCFDALVAHEKLQDNLDQEMKYRFQKAFRDLAAASVVGLLIVIPLDIAWTVFQGDSEFGSKVLLKGIHNS